MGHEVAKHSDASEGRKDLNLISWLDPNAAASFASDLSLWLKN